MKGFLSEMSIEQEFSVSNQGEIHKLRNKGDLRGNDSFFV